MGIELWTRLVEPGPDLAEPGERRRARLLAALLVVLVPAGLLSGLVQLAFVPDFAGTFGLMVGALSILFVAWLGSRGAHYRLSALAASAAPVAACIGVAALNPDDRVWYAFMMIGVLLATLFLTTRMAALVGMGTFAAVVACVSCVPGLDGSDRALPPIDPTCASTGRCATTHPSS
jgi:hypothetical protein